MIQLEDITRTYKLGDEIINALDKVNLTIKDGEFVAIMGPSGSGKTTLANIIGGLDSPTSGTVLIDGEGLSQKNDKNLSLYRNKKVGFVFQTFNLQSGFTALENVMLPLILAKMSGRERKKKAIECLTAVGLADRMNHKPNQLSGGQRQRVSIARALANDPEIIIADEPTGNLDSKKGQEIMDILKALNRNQGITLIIITHDSNIAKQAKKIIEIQDGRIKERAGAGA
ncbi:MAG: ABC transporter ATP-binding protein [Patescibacteria group bacterium]|nr:ABC transporter ATP-binding protein [Patescibacteria group bacterium]